MIDIIFIMFPKIKKHDRSLIAKIISIVPLEFDKGNPCGGMAHPGAQHATLLLKRVLMINLKKNIISNFMEVPNLPNPTFM